MKKIAFIAALLIVTASASTLLSQEAQAQSVQIRPLMYEEALGPGETKKGFVDISNPSNRPVALTTEVQGFKQVDAAGNLEFFPVEYLDKAITLDVTKFELGPKEALRLYFSIDSKKMPEGDIFAAIFARTSPSAAEGITPSAQVGTLLVIENGHGGPRNVELTDLSLPFLLVGESANGTINIKNTANPNESTGFFPQLTTSIGPLLTAEEKLKGPLIFAGITRTVGFDMPTNHFGFYKFTVSSHGTEASKWVFMITGWWRWVVLAIALALLASFITWRVVRKRHTHYKARA